jgi:hypothetical protein
VKRTPDSVLRARHVHPIPGQLPLWPEDEQDPPNPEEPSDSTTTPERNEQ